MQWKKKSKIAVDRARCLLLEAFSKLSLLV